MQQNVSPYPRITTLVDSIMLALKSAEGWRIGPSNSVARKTTCANTSTANSMSSKVGASKTEEPLSSRLATFASICHLPDASYLIHYRTTEIRLHACSVCGDTYFSRFTSYVRPIILSLAFPIWESARPATTFHFCRMHHMFPFLDGWKSAFHSPPCTLF